MAAPWQRIVRTAPPGRTIRCPVEHQLTPQLVHPLAIIRVCQGEERLVGALPGGDSIEFLHHVRPDQPVTVGIPLPGTDPGHPLRLGQPLLFSTQRPLHCVPLSDILHGTHQAQHLPALGPLGPQAARVVGLTEFGQPPELGLQDARVGLGDHLVHPPNQLRQILWMDMPERVGTLGTAAAEQLRQGDTVTDLAGGPRPDEAADLGDPLRLQQLRAVLSELSGTQRITGRA
jgi:hypothetical protein